MQTNEEVDKFLNELKEKIKVFDIAFRERNVNQAGLAELGLMPSQREEYILKLTSENYCSGPTHDTYDPSKPDYYVFGTQIRNKEVYIKISLGLPNKMVDCMSFHIAKHRLNFPLKETNS